MQRNNSSQSRYLTTRIDIKRVINEELGKNKIIPRTVKTFRDESRTYLATKNISKEITPLRSLGAEEVRELLRNEKKKEQEKFTSNKKTRDISYYKDTFTLQATPSEPILSTHDLPTDINHIKKILVTSDYKGVPTAYSPSGFSNPVPCKREHCVERALATHHNAVRPNKANLLPSIAIETDRTYYENLLSTMTPNPGDSLERLYLGNPTGRQDIENLWKWFSFMKAKYDSENNAEAIEAIYEICSREIIRQVSVQCVERGTLLTEVIMRWPQIANNKVEKLLDEMTQLKIKHSIELQDLAAQKDKEMALFKVSVQEIKDQAIMEKELRKSVEEKLSIIKNKLAGVERKYAAEEELWKKINLQKPVLNHKKSFAKNPTKVSINSEIKWKEEERQIENIIDVQEIEALKGIMMKPELLEINKKQQEEEEKFQEHFVQTDNSEIFLGEDKETQTEIFEQDTWRIIKTTEVESNLPTDNTGILLDTGDGVPKIPILKEIIKGIDGNNKNSLDSDRSEKFITAFTISNIEDFRDERENLDKSINESQENGEGDVSEIKDEISIMQSQKSLKSESNVNSPRNNQPALRKTPTKTSQDNRKQSITKPNQKNKNSQKLPQTPEKAQTPKNAQSSASSFKKSAGKRSSVSFVDQLATHLRSVDKMSQEDRLMFFSKLSPEDKQYFISKFSEDDKHMMEIKEALFKEITEKFEQKSKELDSLLSDLEKKKDILELLKLQLYAKQGELENLQESIKPEHREDHERSETLPPIRISQANELEKSKDFLEIKNTSRDRSSSFDSISSNKNVFLKIPDQPNKNFQFESDPNSFTELIPSGSDLGSWKAGWSSGYEKGRSEGIKNGEKLGFEDGYTEGYFKAIQEAKGSQLGSETYAEDIWQEEENKEAQEKSVQPMEENEEDSGFDFACEGKRLPLDYFFIERNRDKKKIKEITKFMEFHFHKPLYLTQPKKPSVAPQLLSALLTKKTSIITKKATMSRRMCNRLAASIYQDCHTKFKNSELFPSLFEVTYDTFIHKYGLKTVAEKKLIEFIASLMKYAEYARPLLFLRFSGASSKIENHDYSKLSFLFYLQSLNFMLNAKIGIVVGYDDSADRQMFPTVRAIECLRDKFDGILDRSIITALISIVEQRSIADPKRINSAGLVELEFLLELMVENYENYQNEIGEGIVFIISALGIEKQEFITKQEFYILTRHISPGKLRDDENNIKDFVPRLKLHPELISNQLDKMEKISFSDLISICIERNLLSIADIKSFCKFNKELTLDIAKEEMNQSKDEVFELLEAIKDSPEKKWKSYDDYIFEEKLNHLLNIKHTEKPSYVLFNWKLLEAELRRIKKDYVQGIQN